MIWPGGTGHPYFRADHRPATAHGIRGGPRSAWHHLDPRLVNAAVMAKIHTVEWTPAMLPHQAANLALNANWYGLATFLLRPRKERKTRSILKIRQPEVGGVVGKSHRSARLGLRSDRRVRRGLPPALVAAGHPGAAVQRDGRGHGADSAGRNPPGRIGEAHPRRRHAGPALLLRQPTPRAVGAEQLSALHAGAEHAGQPRVRSRRRGHPARPRAGCPALQRAAPPARPEPHPLVRGPDLRRGAVGGPESRVRRRAGTAWKIWIC
jgi:hypothetical protein